jgi:starch phosphorylase
MARLTPHFSSNRTVREYTEKFYLLAATSYRKRAENNSALARQIVNWQASIEHNWSELRFGELKIENDIFETEVYLNNLDCNSIKVELYSAGMTKEMEYKEQIPNTQNGHIYCVRVPGEHPASNFTPRITPYFPSISIPLESAKILWQR